MRVTPLVTLGNDQRRRQLGCCKHASRVLRKLLYKLKSSWNQAMGCHRNIPQYSYDLRSYCLNFSDALTIDHTPSFD
ncbi:unnamed protein product [Lathyrus sativus]|nr:unnamed protein product [Lathyrus sativus]